MTMQPSATSTFFPSSSISTICFSRDQAALTVCLEAFWIFASNSWRKCLIMARTGIAAASPSAQIVRPMMFTDTRSEEHTSELQSQSNLVCRLLLEKKKKNKQQIHAANVTKYI